MKKLHINFMNNLQNHEFAELYYQLCDSIDADELDDINAKECCMSVKSHVSEIEFIMPDSGRHELTSVIQKQIRIRTDYVMSLRMQVDGLKITYCDEKRAAANMLSECLMQTGKKLYVPTITSQSNCVRKLLLLLQDDPKVAEAVTLLRLDEHIAAIVAVNKEIEANFMQRSKEISAKTKKNKTIRKAAYRDLKIFVSALNLMLDIHADEQEETIYHQYARNINYSLIYFHTKLKSRTTKRKNKQEVAAAFKKLISIQQEPQNALPVGNKLRNSSTSTSTTSISSETKELEEFLKSTPKRKVSDEKDLNYPIFV